MELAFADDELELVESLNQEIVGGGGIVPGHRHPG
jgi:hypothetical protein